MSKGIIECIRQNIRLFDAFDNVYLFGSVLNADKFPNDVDLLLIYSKKTSRVLDDVKLISSVLKEKCGLPIDLTVLSIDEEKDVEFLKRLKSSYLKLK